MDYILTNEGATLMTKAVTGKNLVFTRAESGDGYSSSPATLTAVIGKRQELTMEVTHEGSDVKIICFLTNHQLDKGYTLKQIGIYAKLEDDEEDTLVIIGQQYSGELIHPFTDGEAEYEFTILMKASGTSSITVENGAGSLALKKDLLAHTSRQDNPHSITAEQIGIMEATDQDIDSIINGTYVDTDNMDDAMSLQIGQIVEKAFIEEE